MPVKTAKTSVAPVALERQKTDFTAEGAPPPGWVSKEPPLTSDPAGGGKARRGVPAARLSPARGRP
jgi:hypothetical protein